MSLGERVKLYAGLIAAGIILTFFCTFAFADSQSYLCTDIIKVRDGDTFVCEVLISPAFKAKQDWPIRINDLDCPETDGWNKKKGLIAKRYLEQKLASSLNIMITNVELNSNKQIKLSFDRLVADVYIDGKDLKEFMIINGGCKLRGN